MLTPLRQATLAFCAQARQQVLGAQTRLDTQPLDLMSQLGDKRNHRRQHQDAIQVNQVIAVAFLDATLCAQFGGQS